MRAMILCAGLGTRLRPLTNTWPKPALPLLGQSLFRYALATLTQAGIREVGINTHHLGERMEAVARAECERAGVALTVSREQGELQGTGGGIRGLKDFLAGGDCVVLNGDVLFPVELGPLIAAHQRSKAAATMVLLPMPGGEAFNAVELDSSGAVRRIAGKGPGGPRLSPWHFSGVHLLSPRVFDFMAKSGPEDINRDVYVRMMEQGVVVHGHVLSDRGVYWSDLGTPRRYAATHQDLLFDQVDLGPCGAASPFEGMVRSDSNYWAHPTAKLADVKVSGPAWFGAGCELSAGVRIGAAVSIGPGAKVGEGAMLNRVAVLDGAVVPPGVLLEDCIISATDSVPTLG